MTGNFVNSWNISIDLKNLLWKDIRGDFKLVRINDKAYQVNFDSKVNDSNFVIVWDDEQSQWIEYGSLGKKVYK